LYKKQKKGCVRVEGTVTVEARSLQKRYGEASGQASVARYLGRWIMGARAFYNPMILASVVALWILVTTASVTKGLEWNME